MWAASKIVSTSDSVGAHLIWRPRVAGMSTPTDDPVDQMNDAVNDFLNASEALLKDELAKADREEIILTLARHIKHTCEAMNALRRAINEVAGPAPE